MNYANVILEIERLKKEAEENNLLDTQEYLDFLDKLNWLSIDQDRPDTKKGKNLN